MGLLTFLAQLSDEMDEQKKKERKAQLEKEMKAYDLEEHEKELVRKGEYNPWDFETKDANEDDDYYKEDEE